MGESSLLCPQACKAMLARGPEKTGNGGEGGSSTAPFITLRPWTLLNATFHPKAAARLAALGERTRVTTVKIYGYVDNDASRPATERGSSQEPAHLHRVHPGFFDRTG